MAPSERSIAVSSRCRLFQPIGVTSIFGELQLNDALYATPPATLSAWKASSFSVYGPGTTRTGVMFPSSADTGFEIKGALRAFRASRSGPGAPHTMLSYVRSDPVRWISSIPA